MAKRKAYDNEYKIQAIQLAEKLGGARAADELGISRNTIYTWVRSAKKGHLSTPKGMVNPEDALSLTEELIELRKKNKEQEKEIARLNKLNNFLEEASAFFAASRLK